MVKTMLVLLGVACTARAKNVPLPSLLAVLVVQVPSNETVAVTVSFRLGDVQADVRRAIALNPSRKDPKHAK
jgi:hypothetical protein